MYFPSVSVSSPLPTPPHPTHPTPPHQPQPSIPSQVCTGSICESFNLEVCTCASEDGKDETELCHVCCMEKSECCTPA